jgi:hypothetical protein
LSEKPRSPRQMLEQDLEQLEKEVSKTPVVIENTPHDSAEVYSQVFGKHTEAILPLLDTKENGKSGALILALLIGVSVFAAWGVAYEVQYQITPHIQGVCPSPAVIENGGCFDVVSSTNANGGSVTTLVPAGHIGP